MSSVLSSALMLVLFVALAIPAVLGGGGGAAGRVATAFYALLSIGVLAHYASLPTGSVPDAPAVAGPADAVGPSSPCEQALAAAQRNRVVLDRSAPARLVVNREYWRMLPENVRAALTDCASQLHLEDGHTEAVEVVERAG